nr:unnamed protein product [Spirometra erinaceieuropaei]
MSPCLHVLATTSRPLSSALSFRTSLLLHLTFLLLLHHASRVTGTSPLTTTSGASVFLEIRQGSGGNDSESLVSVEPFSYGDAPNSSVCRRALGLASTHAAKCEVARDFSGCKFDSGFIPYLKFQYCYFESPIVPTILMVLWLLTLLGAFAVIADSFFSPSLIALARSMRMSQNLAGVTLLAFGNGAPDVFSAITAITTGDPEAPDEGLGLGFLMGSGLLVNTVTAGLIMIIRPFKTTRRPFIKDTLFYMSAVTWSAVILVRRMIYLSDAVDNRRSNRPERRTALVARELARYKVDIAALNETRFSEQGQLEEVCAGYTFFWSGRPLPEPRNAGVAFAIRNDIVGRLPCLPQGINDRLISLRLPL